MSVTVPVLTPLQCPADNVVLRSTANFHPNLWGDRFLTYNSDDTAAYEYKQQQIEELKEEVRNELKDSASKCPEPVLKLIDSIQLLGLSHHFEREIEEALKNSHQTHNDLLVDDNEDLTNASLRFRLLRQEGYPVSSYIFSKFKDKEGKFKESLIGDSPGMLALYEAAHLMVHGEDILEEVLAFTTAHLQSIVTDHPNNPFAKRVIRALNRPIRKGLPRLEARHYISIFQEEGSCNKSLLKLAKLDFNMLQSNYRKELSEITVWWKGFDFARKLPFARDRLVESYFWAVGVFFEPQYFLARSFFTKVTAILAIMDDIYDAYGTIEELEIFTEAIERWDINCIDQLPVDYLKLFYRAILVFYEEMEEEMALMEGKSFQVHYAKEAMKRQTQSYFVEAKWLNQGYTPTFDEYLSNALLSSCHTVIIATSLVGMGDIIRQEALQWVLDRPKIIKASELIGRIMNDIVSHEFEQSRMHIPTSVQCYMKQYDVTKYEAYDELNKQVVSAWKDINHESLKPTQVPLPVIVRVLNFTRVEDIVYKEADDYTHAGNLMKDLIALMLIDPIPI